MVFELIWTGKAKKDLKKLEHLAAKRIFEKIIKASREEQFFLEKVKGFSFFKFRVGDYRVLIKKFSATKKLVILGIKHRKNTYKNLK